MDRVDASECKERPFKPQGNGSHQGYWYLRPIPRAQSTKFPWFEATSTGSGNEKKKPKGSNHFEYSQKEGVYSNQVPEDNQLNYPGIISPITKKENSNKNTKLSLSDEFLPHKIKAYIAGVKPHRKRIEEEYHLQQFAR